MYNFIHQSNGVGLNVFFRSNYKLEELRLNRYPSSNPAKRWGWLTHFRNEQKASGWGDSFFVKVDSCIAYSVRANAATDFEITTQFEVLYDGNSQVFGSFEDTTQSEINIL